MHLGYWNFLQRNFLPRLLFGGLKTVPPFVGDISTVPVKKYSLLLQSAVTSAADKYNSFLRAIYNIIVAIMGEREFSTSDHIQAVKEERWDKKQIGTL